MNYKSRAYWRVRVGKRPPKSGRNGLNTVMVSRLANNGLRASDLRPHDSTEMSDIERLGRIDIDD